MLPLKLLFQSVCQLKLPWDDPLPEHLSRQWSEILGDMRRISFVEIPRCNIFLRGMEINDIRSLQIDAFADSSERAYAAKHLCAS